MLFYLTSANTFRHYFDQSQKSMSLMCVQANNCNNIFNACSFVRTQKHFLISTAYLFSFSCKKNFNRRVICIVQKRRTFHYFTRMSFKYNKSWKYVLFLFWRRNGTRWSLCINVRLKCNKPLVCGVYYTPFTRSSALWLKCRPRLSPQLITCYIGLSITTRLPS